MNESTPKASVAITFAIILLIAGIPHLLSLTGQTIKAVPATANPPYPQNALNIPIVGEDKPDRQQAEPTIAVDPRNSSIIVAGAQDYRLKAVGEHRWHGYYRSTDGGNTWTSSLLPGFPGDESSLGLESPLHASNATSDPVLAFDSDGNVYYTGLVFNISTVPDRSGITIHGSTVFVAKYTNEGANYSGVTLVKGPLFADKPWIAVDTSGKSSDGAVYVVFDANLTVTSQFGTLLTRSTDGGRTFSRPFYVPYDMSGELPGVTVDPFGNVYVSTDAFNPVTENQLDYIQVSRVLDFATGASSTVTAVGSASFLPSPLPGAKFRAFTIPQIASDSQGVYLVYDDMGSGNANVYFAKSVDKGITWTPRAMVNDDSPAQHFFPTVSVSSGTISIAWYDSRLSAQNLMNRLDVFYAYSLDGGASFSSNVRVTIGSFDPNLVKRTDDPTNNDPFIGDYFQIAATPRVAHLIWTDNMFACDIIDQTYGCVDQDAFTATINIRDFNITTSERSLVVTQGQHQSFHLHLASPSLIGSNVTVGVRSQPVGLPLSPSNLNLDVPAEDEKSFNISISPSVLTPVGAYELNITGQSSFVSRSVRVQVTVQSFLTKAGSTIAKTVPTLLNYLFPILGVGLGVVAIGSVLVYAARRVTRKKRPWADLLAPL